MYVGTHTNAQTHKRSHVHIYSLSLSHTYMYKYISLLIYLSISISKCIYIRIYTTHVFIAIALPSNAASPDLKSLYTLKHIRICTSISI